MSKNMHSTVCIFMTPTTIHVHPVHSIDAKALATKLDCQPSWKYLLYFEFSFVFIVFAIYPKLLNIFSSTLVAYIPQEYLPFTFKPFHHGPYQDPQAL